MPVSRGRLADAAQRVVNAAGPSLVRWCLRAAKLGVMVWGVWILIRPAVHIFALKLEDLWVYQNWEAHRFTAMSMLTGSLRWHYSLVSLGGDEEVYNGAGYTHWGYGVPLLQIPFHAVARYVPSLPARFFPDRAILFAYLAVAVPIVWAGFDRVLAMRERPGSSRLRRHVLSWSATMYVLCTGLYPLLASRLQVYDETIAYFVMIELVALSAYAFFLGSSGSLPVVALAVAAGMGLLVRQTGAIYLGIWMALVVLERRALRTTLVFAGVLAPFALFWVATNWVRTGLPWSMGFQNSLPGPERVDMVRFGSACVDTGEHTKQVAFNIFKALFMVIPQDLPPWLKACGFGFEPRNNPADKGSIEPYLGAGVLLFLVWTFLHHVLRRERRLALYLPHVGIACLFGGYVYGGVGLGWRYFGDFWPLVFLAAVQLARTLPAAATPLLGWPLAAALIAGAASTYRHDVEPGKKLVENLDLSRVPHMWSDFESTRSGQDKSLPSKVHCGAFPDWPRFNVGWRSNVFGWRSNCTVDMFSELFLGVPPGTDDSFVIRFTTEGMWTESARVYVNGRMYTARKVGSGYETPVRIHRESLTSPTVLASIEWTHGIDPVEGKLLEVELR